MGAQRRVYTLVFGGLEQTGPAAIRIDGEVPGRRTHSLRRRGSHACLGSPPPRINITASSILTTGVGSLAVVLLSTGCSRRRSQDDAARHFAGSDQPPQRDEQLARQRNDQRLAGGTARVGGAGSIPLCQGAVFLKHQKAPGQLDHAAAHAGVARPGQPLFPPPRPALVRRAAGRKGWPGRATPACAEA